MLRLSVDWLVYSFLRIPQGSKAGEVLGFFLYDSIKILALLWLMIFVIGVLRTYLPQAKVKTWLSRKGGLGNFAASIFGAVTPFCSCSSIPIFFGFLKAGIPLGIAFSFLITSPLINEYLVVLMLGFFGWKITLFYVTSGILIGVISGLILGRMNLERHLVKDLISTDAEGRFEMPKQGIRGKILFGLNEAGSITRKIWMWVLVGIGIGALIHNYVPEESIQAVVGKAGIFSVPIATLLGVPMYGSCAAIVPVAVVLFQKGIPLGTAIAFMMAIVALSLPEAIMLRRAMKLKLIAIFFTVTAAAIIMTGYLLNALQPLLNHSS